MREHLICAAESHIGHVREKNEDSYAIINDGRFPFVLIIADGMGGHRSGEVASQIAVNFVRDQIVGLRQEDRSAEDWCRLISDLVEKANVRVCLDACQDEDKRGMGTTLTIALVLADAVVITHVGDSRAYLLRDGVLVQMTDDHTLVQEMVAAGTISPEESAGHPHRHVLTRALGTPEHVVPDHLILPREKHDRYLLCTDGLHGYVADRQIESVMRHGKDPADLVEQLIRLALEAGGEDNITVLAAY